MEEESVEDSTEKEESVEEDPKEEEEPNEVEEVEVMEEEEKEPRESSPLLKIMLFLKNVLSSNCTFETAFATIDIPSSDKSSNADAEIPIATVFPFV